MILAFLIPAAVFCVAIWATLACLQPYEKNKDASIGPGIAALIWFAFFVSVAVVLMVAERQH